LTGEPLPWGTNHDRVAAFGVDPVQRRLDEQHLHRRREIADVHDVDEAGRKIEAFREIRALDFGNYHFEVGVELGEYAVVDALGGEQFLADAILDLLQRLGVAAYPHDPRPQELVLFLQHRFQQFVDKLPVGAITEIGIDPAALGERSLAALGDESQGRDAGARDQRFQGGGLAGHLGLAGDRHVPQRHRDRRPGSNLVAEVDGRLFHHLSSP
jgi:hypothetical protein